MRVSSKSRPPSAGERKRGAGKVLLSTPKRSLWGRFADPILHPPGMGMEVGWEWGGSEGTAKHP